MSCCLQRTDGAPAGGGGGAVAAAEWTERYLGDFAAAPVVDLAAGVNPTVAVANTTATAGQVASATWTSNAGDAAPAVTQGPVTTFATDGATGLVFVSADASNLLTETAQDAAHIWCLWSDLLGEDPRPGVDYCVQVLFTANLAAEINVNGEAAGLGVYWPNDGAVPAGLFSNPAIDDEKRLAGWFEFQNAAFGLITREESTPFQQIAAPRLPANVDICGLMFLGGIARGVCATAAAGAFPDPAAMTMIPGPFFGGSTTYPSRPYLDPTERVALAFQTQLGAGYSATIRAVRVLSRGQTI